MNVLRYEQTGAVGQIVLCNPPDNQLSRQFVDELTRAVHQASVSNSRALLVRAEGPNFGAGAAAVEWPGKDVHWFHTYISELNQAYKALEALRVPTIAAVRGKAIGGHYELILHCDLIVAAKDATLFTVETGTGMVPLVGGLQRLAERIGRARALELVLFPAPLTGAAAKEFGLVCRAVEDEEVDKVATEMAEHFASGATLAYGAAKALLKAWSSGGVSGADDLLLDLCMRLFESQDAQAAFREIKTAMEGGADKAEAERNVHFKFQGV